MYQSRNEQLKTFNQEQLMFPDRFLNPHFSAFSNCFAIFSNTHPGNYRNALQLTVGSFFPFVLDYEILSKELEKTLDNLIKRSCNE